MWGFGKKKEEPKKEETKVVKQEPQSNNQERKDADERIGEFSGTKVKFLYSGPVGEYPGWK